MGCFFAANRRNILVATICDGTLNPYDGDRGSSPTLSPLSYHEHLFELRPLCDSHSDSLRSQELIYDIWGFHGIYTSASSAARENEVAPIFKILHAYPGYSHH